MTYPEFLKNEEIGKLIQYGYDLHKRDFKEDYTGIPNYYYYNGSSIHKIKLYKNGAIRGNIFFDDHTTVYASINLIVVPELNKHKRALKNCLFIQTDTESYRPHFSILKENTKTKKLENDKSIEEIPFEDKLNIFIKALEFLGFKKEDIIKVFKKEITAKQAYQNIAPEELKNRIWICYERKIFEFDNNIAIQGDYSGIYLDSFPFPFKEQPILDCSKVKTAGVYFKNNQKKVKLININSNQKSITGTNLKEAIIDEVIDASKVDISYTTFGEQKIINLNKSISRIIEDKNIRLAYFENEKEIKKPKIRLLSSTSSVDSTINAISNATEEIGLFRNEAVLESNQELISYLVNIINSDWWWLSKKEDQPFLNKIEELFYSNTSKLFTILKDIPITFRLTDIKVEELSKKANIELEENFLNLRGALALTTLEELLFSEATGLIKAAKEHNKTLNILIPYINNESDFVATKNRVLTIAKRENYYDIRFGAMIENTESIYEVDKIAEQADFISIGTNDLTESVLHKKRSINDRDFQILNEEVKKYINKIVHRVKRSNNIPINICGEHSNYFENIEYYLSLDIDTITCNQSLIPGYNDFLNTYYEKNKQKQKGTD